MRFLRVGPSGIRGAVGTALTGQLAIKYASAFGTWLDGGTVGVAIDTRTSSPMFKSACFAGLLATGCNVVDFGICPAPVLHFAVKRLGRLECGCPVLPARFVPFPASVAGDA